jgi:hypothetical protein
VEILNAWRLGVLRDTRLNGWSVNVWEIAMSGEARLSWITSGHAYDACW